MKRLPHAALFLLLCSLYVAPAPAVVRPHDDSTSNKTRNHEYDLTIRGYDAPDPVRIGDELIYQFAVYNEEEFNRANGVTLTGMIPSGVTLVSVESTNDVVTVDAQGNIGGRWAFLDPGDREPVMIKVRVSRPTAPTLHFMVSVAGDDPSGEQRPDDNSLALDTTVEGFVPSVSIAISDAPDPAIPGSQIVYTMTVSNVTNPAIDLTGVAVQVDVLPAGTTFASVTSSQGTSTTPEPGQTGPVRCDLGMLAASANATVRLTLNVTQSAPDQLSLTAVAESALGAAEETAITFVLAPNLPFLTWNPPEVPTPSNPQPPPQNARIQAAGSAKIATGVEFVADAKPRVQQTPGVGALVGYKVYRASTPNVEPSPNNIFGTFPPNQTNTGSASVSGGAYFVVTACYSTGESKPSNEVSSGAGEPVISKLKVTNTKIVATGSSFASPVQVSIDGIPFASLAALKKNNTKAVQKGALMNGETIAQYFTPGRTVLLCYRNASGATTCLEFARP